MPRIRSMLGALALLAPLMLAGRAARAQGGQAAADDSVAHFTRAELEDYHRVYRNADVKYLRRIFDAYAAGKPLDEELTRILGPFDRALFRQHFTVMSREPGVFGITTILLVSQEIPDRVYRAGVYERSPHGPVLRELEDAGVPADEMHRIRVRYREFLEDRAHSM